MATDEANILVFGGLNPRDDISLPEWWSPHDDGKDVNQMVDPTSFRDTIRQLPRAVDTQAGWRHPLTDEWIPTEQHNALINPERMAALETPLDTGGDGKGQGDTALWYIPTSDYEIINPAQFLDPLADAIEGQELTEAVFGEFELHRGGGRVRGDVYFDTQTIDLSHIDRDPVMLGVEVGWDFFGGTAAYAQGMGMDTGCVNSLRRLTDRITVRHRGNVDDRIDFWDELLRQIDLVADRLAQQILEAERTILRLGDMPFDLGEFFDLLGFPEYLADRAAGDIQANASDPFAPTLWEVHSGATYALTHFARGTADSIEEYHRRANDLLMNPILAIERVEQAYDRQRTKTESDAKGPGTGRAAIADLSGSLEEKRLLYEKREEEIKSVFQQI